MGYYTKINHGVIKMFSLIYPIVTRKEAIQQGLKTYFTGKLCKRGHLSERTIGDGCIACARVRYVNDAGHVKIVQQRRKIHYEKHKTAINEKHKEYVLNNKEKVVAYYKQDYINNKEDRQLYYKQHRTHYINYYKEYGKRKRVIDRRINRYHNNRSRYVICARFNRTKFQQAIPTWYDTEKELIKTIYQKRNELSELWGIKLHVDHIIPINPKDKSVCGLHCWANLQLLEATINGSKGYSYQTDW